MHATKPTGRQRFVALALCYASGAAGFAAYCLYTGNEKFYRDIFMPLSLRLFPDAEQAHRFAVKLCANNLFPKCRYESDRLKPHTLFAGIKFENPVGLAAGFDKQGECVEGTFRTGFGFTEIGSVTPLPQAGNAQPRVFRLLDDEAVINRYGFNSDGFDAVFERLTTLLKTQRPGPVGVNLGKNKSSPPDDDEDYVAGVRKFGRIADYLVINVSSPNTPGLRSGYQHQAALIKLLTKVVAERDKLITSNRVPIFLKISPDLTFDEKSDIVAVLNELGRGSIDGLIVSNTTVSRPDNTVNAAEIEGGLSGRPIKSLALRTLKDMYTLTHGEIPLIGCGGISDGHDAYERIRAGASLVQIYTAMVFQGPPVVRRILRELDQLLARDGFDNVSQAVGIDANVAVDDDIIGDAEFLKEQQQSSNRTEFKAKNQQQDLLTRRTTEAAA